MNRPGHRYMFVRDGKGRIVKIWGGYCPKIQDGSFLEAHKEEFKTSVRDAVIIADNHFSKGKNFLKKMALYSILTSLYDKNPAL